jgi:hypothetical protein
MKWLFRRDKKENPASGTVRGNKHLTKEEKNARIEAQEMAKKAADEATKIATEKAKKARDLSNQKSERTRQEKAKKQRTDNNSIGKFFRDILNGTFLTGDGITTHIPYLLFMCGIFLMYISLGYKFENIEREKMKTEHALEEVTAEYKTLRSELESRLQQSRVESATAFLGLQQPIEPPVILEVDVK